MDISTVNIAFGVNPSTTQMTLQPFDLVEQVSYLVIPFFKLFINIFLKFEFYLGYFFWLSKFIDMLDTVFFVLRKKSSQVTTLHIVHHGILPITVWPGLRYANGGNTAVCCVVNGGVHVVMYAYYFLSAMGPRVQAVVSKFKKYVTRIQITQFIAMIIHSFLFLIVEDCGFPVICSCWVALNEILFLFLFLDFYKNAYGKKAKQSSTNNNNQTISKSDKKSM